MAARTMALEFFILINAKNSVRSGFGDTEFYNDFAAILMELAVAVSRPPRGTISEWRRRPPNTLTAETQKRNATNDRQEKVRHSAGGHNEPTEQKHPARPREDSRPDHGLTDQTSQNGP
jgi:hypothetical protein